MAIERDENGRLRIRRRPKKRETVETTSEAVPMTVEETTETTAVPVRYDRLGRRIVRNEARLCTARTVDGEPCKAYAIRGSNVCAKHGGAAPQVKAAAKVRLENAADRMAAALLGIAENAESETVKLAAIKDALDRAGLSPRQAMDIDVGLKPWQQAMGLVRVRHGRPSGGEPRVIEGSVVTPEPATQPEWMDKLAAKAPLEPVDYSERVGSDDDGEPIPLIEPPVSPPRDIEDTPNGPATVATTLHDIVAGTGGAKAMLRAANARNGTAVRHPTRTAWRS